jgi:hypothetical protein
MITVSITEANVFQALGQFLQSVLPSGFAVMRGQVNRVAEPGVADFAVMWPILRERLEYNVDSYADIAFVGSITATTLTVTQILQGKPAVGQLLGANGIAANTTITAPLVVNSDGTGTYTVSVSQTLASETIQAGSKNLMQPMKITMQVDVHGPNSADNSQIISTVFRDETGVETFDASGFGVEPIYCDDPRQAPFVNGEQQVEERWILTMAMQANPFVAIPQQFAGALKLNPVIAADEVYAAH